MFLDPKDPNVWDYWRREYHRLSDDEQIQFIEDIEKVFPDQKHFTLSNYDALFETVQGVRVFEVGGWKGELAAYCLSKFSITSWLNMELCFSAVKRTVQMPNNKYYTSTPSKFRWFEGVKPAEGFDICILSHVVEHFSNVDLTMLLIYLRNIPKIMIEAPIEENGQTWAGYEGTHKLLMGWSSIRAILWDFGFTQTKINETCYLFSKAKK